MKPEIILILNLLMGLLTVGVAGLVLQVWMPTVKKWDRRTWFGPHEWLLLGITLGFTMTIGDNIFWGITWYSKLRAWPTSQWWFDHGPWANLVFRHTGKICAAMCHLEAARQASVITSEDLATRTAVVIAGSVTAFSVLLF